MKLACVDANVILRLLTNDPAEMAENAQALFAAVDRGEIQLYLPEIVVAEVVWVLRSFYGHAAQDIGALLQDFLSHDGLMCRDKPGLLRALNLFVDRNIDCADALVAVQMEELDIEEVYSFDQHFDRVEGITRLSPG